MDKATNMTLQSCGIEVSMGASHLLQEISHSKLAQTELVMMKYTLLVMPYLVKTFINTAAVL